MVSWKSLPLSLALSFRSHRARRAFELLQRLRAALAPFAEPDAIVTALASKAGPPRNEMVRELVMAWRESPAVRDLVAAILIIASWPDLDAVYEWQAPRWPGESDELGAQLGFHFLRAVASTTAAAPDLGKSLVRAARRDAIASRPRGSAFDPRDLRIGDILVDAGGGAKVAFGDMAEGDLRRALAGRFGSSDVELLVALFVRGGAPSVVAERFGTTQRGLGMRVARIVTRIRRLA